MAASTSAKAGMGTGPPAATIAALPLIAGMPDKAGIISIGTGTVPPAASDIVGVAYGNVLINTNPAVLILPWNAATINLGGTWGIVANNQAGFTVHFSGTLAASQANGTYQLLYIVLEELPI